MFDASGNGDDLFHEIFSKCRFDMSLMDFYGFPRKRHRATGLGPNQSGKNSELFIEFYITTANLVQNTCVFAGRVHF
jgi:hypothetical protein